MLSRIASPLLALVLSLVSCHSFASEYRLGPQDKVRLMVFEWRSSRAEAYAWAPLNGEFTISSNGMLSLPLVGDIRAESLTVEELAKLVSDRLQSGMGLVERPSTSVEIAQFRPFYIVGDVANSGEFPYRPGLTVLKAVSVAGGPYRMPGVGFGWERDAIMSRGDLRVMDVERTGLMARRARLKAEGTEQNDIEFPPELMAIQSRPGVAELLREEQMIFRSRRNAVRSKIESLNQGKLLFDKEIAALKDKEVSLNNQLVLARRERENVTALTAKGLAVSGRQLSTEQVVAQLENARLDVGIARLRAEQDRAKLDRDVFDLQDQRRADTLLELRQTEARLEELRERSATSERLIFNAEVSTPRRLAENRRDEESTTIYTIIRATPDGTREVEATDSTLIEPGDVLRVRRLLPALPYGEASAQSASSRATSAPPAPVSLAVPRRR